MCISIVDVLKWNSNSIGAINSNIEIEVDPFNQFEFFNINNFKINRINNIKFEIIFDFNIYDFSENDWIESKLITRYEKMKE